MPSKTQIEGHNLRMKKDKVKISVSWQSSDLKLRHTIWIWSTGLRTLEQSGTENYWIWPFQRSHNHSPLFPKGFIFYKHSTAVIGKFPVTFLRFFRKPRNKIEVGISGQFQMTNEWYSQNRLLDSPRLDSFCLIMGLENFAIYEFPIVY